KGSVGDERKLLSTNPDHCGQRGDSQENPAENVALVLVRESKAANKKLREATHKAGLLCESPHRNTPRSASGAGYLSLSLKRRKGENFSLSMRVVMRSK